jgi:hypothetical protein
VLALLATGAIASVVAFAGTTPIWSGSSPDATGDSGSGPDISSLDVTVGSDQTLTLSVTLSNRTGIAGNESVQFFLRVPQTDAEANVSQFGDGSPPTLNTWNGSSWQTYHYLSGGFTGSTFSTTVSLDDLQSALQVPVRPGLWVTVKSYTGATPGATPVQADTDPATGYMPVQTQPAAPTTAATTTTATPPPPPTTTTTPQRAKGPTRPIPTWSQRIVRLPHARIEWKRLVITRIPTGAKVTLACTKGCSRRESPRVVRGQATSRRFVGVPFAKGQVFTTKVVERDGAAWWWQTTIVAKPGGRETATKIGCTLVDGTSLPFAKC